MAKIRDKQPDADAGREKVDEQLEGLEARLTSMYAQAGKELETDLSKFLNKYEKEDAEKKAQVESGELSEDDYKNWRERQIFRSDAMKAKISDLSTRLVNADQQAMSMVNNQLPETYATSYNFGGFRAEKQAGAAGFDYTQFTIINQDAVRTLATEDPDLIPWKPDVDVAEDEKWNRKHVQEAIQQGIVKGDSMDDVAKRLLPVVNMDRNAAIRTARTAVNGIENKGRKDATERVKEAGIPMVETWSCTHDNRTRDTHILLDGTTPDDNKMFGKGILSILMAYPGDPAGDPAEVYNCRCGLVSSIKGIDHSKDDELYAKMMEEEYFEDWVQVKEDRQEKEAAFQSKKEGAAERVAAKMAQFDENNASLTKEDSEDIKENSIFGLDLNTPHYENFSDTFQEIIPDYADRVARGDYPTMKELRELYKKAETEQDELLLEFLTNSQSYIQTYKNFSDEEKRQYAEIFSVLRSDSDTALYRGESGKWVEHYGEFTEGKTITFESFGFTTPHDRDELEAMKSYDVLFEFEKGTPCINTANQVWDDHLILGNFEIVSADQYENGQQHVVLRYIDSQPGEQPEKETEPAVEEKPDLSKFGLEEVTDFDAEEFNYIDSRYGKYQYELAQEMEEFTDEDMLFVKIDDGKHVAYAAVDPDSNSLEGIVSTGGGQGTELLGRVMEYQESQGEGLMWLADNPDSVSYYEHLGLGEFGKGDKNEKLYEISAEDMSKALEKVNEHRDIPEELPPAKELIDPGDLSSGKREVVQGEDISGTWERRSEQFEFAIDDIIDAQGFNGLPKVVSEEEFEKAVKESNFIAQRTYSAPSQEVLDSYRDQLYNGDWYVDCSVGHSSFGQGMYCTQDFATEMSQRGIDEQKSYARITQDRIEENAKNQALYDNYSLTVDEVIEREGVKDSEIADVIRAYNPVEGRYQSNEWQVTKNVEWVQNFASKNPEKYAEAKSIINKNEDELEKAYRDATREVRNIEIPKAVSYTETFTLSPDAKIGNYSELIEEMKKDSTFDDVSIFATAKGYDAINIDILDGKIEANQAIILNRSKVIFREDKGSGKK